MEKTHQIFVLLENKPGTSFELCRILKKKNIAIFAIAMFVDSARLHTSDPEATMKALQEHGYNCEIREVLREILPNEQGAMMQLTQKLSNAGININYLYGSIEEKQKHGMLILEVDQPKLALDLFRNHKY
jgi:hypothetical protein